jgi:hypothetical protein
MSNVASVVNHFSTANEGFTTTTGSSTASGATSVLLTSSSGLTNGTIFVGIIEPGGTKQQVFTGTVDTGTNSITGVKWTRGTNVLHASGVTVVDYVTGTDHNMMTKGLLVSLNQDGTLKSGAVSTSAMVLDGIITTTKLAANAVTKATTVWDELVTSSGTYSNATVTPSAVPAITGSVTSATGGDLLCLIEGSFYNSLGTTAKFNLKIGGTSYTFRRYTNEINSHKYVSRTILATGIAAGTYTCTLEAAGNATSTTVCVDGSDWWRLTIVELKK